MVVDLAHPDCGLLSLSVVCPLSEQSQHREEGERGEKRWGGGGGGGGQLARCST